MRNFYIFKINKEVGILTKDSPYMLFKSLESIYKNHNVYIASNLYEQIASKINKIIINNKIKENYKDCDFYYYTKDQHNYYNKYRNEVCIVNIKNSFINCKTNSNRLILLNKLSDYDLFVCDFDNKDYFWLNEIYC